MSDSNFNPASGEPCREISGFLFSHPCEQMSRYRCERCAKPICPQHVAYDDLTTLCIACSQADPKLTQQKKRELEHHSDFNDQHPYWYSRTYYSTYSWHDNDFTEADESVLIGGNDDDVQWEQDMGAS